jgi:hypothetical protein
MRFPASSLLVGGARRTEARNEAEAGAGPEGGVERGGAAWGEERSRCPGPEGGEELRAGWRDSCWRRDSPHALTIRPTGGRLVLKTETL